MSHFKIVHDAFDSGILGYKCGRLEITCDSETVLSEKDFLSAIGQAQSEGFKYLRSRRPEGEWQRLHALEQAGFVTVDGIIQFAKKTSDEKKSKLATLRLAKAFDADAVGRLAAKTFTISRFHNDPLITKDQAEKIHYEWAKNSCLGIAAKAVLVVEDAGAITGFVTCKFDGKTGIIDLIGVDGRAAGHGLGRELVERANEWFFEQGCEHVTVQTQTNNLAAMNLYVKCGFVIAACSRTLRWASEDLVR